MIKIMIVDDKDENLYMLQSLFESSGYKTISAKNGAEALGLMTKEIPDLIITDILMPVMDGFTLCRECKRDKSLKKIPFFFYTATYTNLKDEEFALSLGADRFILKPQEPEVFVQIIDDFLKENSGKKHVSRKIEDKLETVVLKEYNEVLIRKIEDKMVQSAINEKELRKYAEKLEEEISERRKKEASLRESQHLFQTLAQVLPVGIFKTTRDGDTTYVNPKWSELSGLPIEEALGSGWLKAVHPGDRDKVSGHWSEDLKSSEESNSEYRFLRPDGSIVWVIGKAVPEMVDNEIIGYIGTITDITDRKEFENAIIESEEKFRNLFDLSPVGKSLTGMDGSLNVNKSFSDILGYTVEDLRTRTWKDISFPDDIEKADELTKSLTDGKISSARFEKRYIHKNGYIVWADVSTYLHRDKVGTPLFFVTSINDITTRKLYEETIEFDRIRLRTLIDNLPSLVYILDYGCRKVVSNQADFKNTGFSSESEVLGKNDLELYPGETGERGHADNQIVVKSGIPIINREESFTDRNGIQRWLLTSKYPIFDPHGKITGLVGIGHDITGRKQAEEALAESETKYRQLVTKSPDGIFIVDLSGKFMSVNSAICNSLKYTEEELLSMMLMELVPEKYHALHKERLSALIKGEGSASNAEYEVKGKDGIIHFIEVQSVPYYKENRLVGFQGIAHDITERKNASESLKIAKEKAEESDRLKTAFLHNISHEIRTPLNAIVGFSSLLCQPEIDEVSKLSFTDTIAQSSDQLLAIISDIIEISNIEAGILKPTEDIIEINLALQRLYDQFRPKAVERNILFNKIAPLPDNEAIINSDKTKFIQIFSNLLNNAFKFTKSGRIEFGYSLSDNFINFYVSDTGIGIPEPQHQRIFDRFYQVESILARHFEGTGLGLSISKAFVELLGGKIWVDSESGKGSIFYFSLPYNKPEVAIPPFSESPQEVSFNKSISILVAEDDENNYNLIMRFLNDPHLKPIRAKNGAEAVKYCESDQPVDLVLMDLKMPVMDGYEATTIILKLMPELPIIAQTAFVTDREKAAECGCIDLITKPFNRNDLLGIIKKHLKKKSTL